MKIVSGAGLRPSPPKPAVPDEKPGQGFASFLKDTPLATAMLPLSQLVGPQPGGGHSAQTFAFGALGMFGRYGAVAAPTPQRMEAEAGPAMASGDMADEIQPIEQPSLQSQATVAPELASAEAAFTSAICANVTVPSAAVPSTIRFERDVSVPTTTVGSAGWSICPADDGPETSQFRSVPIRYRDIFVQSDAGSLLVAGEDAALSIVARSAGTGVKHAILHRAVRETAAEFGMQVSELLLNGENHVFTITRGDDDGGHAR